jgi:hypothetical protein
MVLSSSQMANIDDDTRWLHSDTDLLSGHGVIYNVNVIILFVIYLLFNLFLFLVSWFC